MIEKINNFINCKKIKMLFYLTVILILFYIIFPPLIPIFFLSKSFLLLIILLCSIFLALIIFLKKLNIHGFPLLWFLFLFLTLLNNYDIKNETPSIWCSFLISILIMMFASTQKNWFSNTCKIIFVFTFFHAVFTIICYIFPSFYFNYVISFFPNSKDFLINLYKNNCMAGFSGHYSTNAIYITYATLLSFTYLIKNKKISNLFIFLISMYSLFLTGKRAHLILVIIALFFMYIFSEKEHKMKEKLKKALIILLSGSICVIILSFFITSLQTTFLRIISANNITELLNGRSYFWQWTITYFLQNPILGLGWGGFKYEYYKLIGPYDNVNKYVDAHNTYLQVLCELGLVGFITFISLIIANIKRTIYLWTNTNNRNLPYISLCIGIQIFFILYCLSGNPLYDFSVFFIYSLSMSYVYSNLNRNHLTFEKIKSFIYEIKKDLNYN